MPCRMAQNAFAHQLTTFRSPFTEHYCGCFGRFKDITITIITLIAQVRNHTLGNFAFIFRTILK